MAELIPEPPDGALVLVGEPLMGVVLVRDDSATREADFRPLRRWCGVEDDEDEPLSWAQVVGAEPDQGRLAHVPRVITRLFTEQELREAVAAGGYEQIGDHRIALGPGRCVVHGEVYEPHELERLRERAGGGSGG